MKPSEDKIYAFAERMAEHLFDMRNEDLCNNLDVDDSVTYDEEYANKILEDPAHVKNIKQWIKTSVIAKLGADPLAYVNDAGDDYEYKSDTYDHAYLMDEYIQQQYDGEREARLKKKWKVWIEIERIETDPENPMDEDYIDEEIPFGIAYCDSLEDALELRENINTAFGEINPPLPQRMEDDFINDDELLNS